MKFIDLFSGIGGFRSGLENNGHECVAFCEIDKYARQSYKAIYNTENEVEFHDITAISNDDFRQFRGKCDIIAGGFPCQAFSIAGKRRGFEDTRGTLFFDIARAIKEIKPSFALLENVKGLFSHDKGRTFGTIIQALDELGYVVEWGLFNSKYWGVPQNRERVFILATRKDIFKQPKLINLLNKQTEVNTRLIDVLEKEVDEKYYLSDEKTEKLTAMIDEKYNVKETTNVIKQIGNIDQQKRERKNPNTGRVYDPSGISPTLSTMQGGGLEPKVLLPKTYHDVLAVKGDLISRNDPQRQHGFDNEKMFTLRCAVTHGVAIKEDSSQGGNRKPKIAVKGFKEIVEVRKYVVNKIELSELLRVAKQDAGISNKEISNILNVPITKVEHWFRSDNSFSIPDRDIWYDLKNLLSITNTEHDEAVTTFEKKESEFDTTNRVYDTEHLSPTLNTSSKPKIAIPFLTTNQFKKDEEIKLELVGSLGLEGYAEMSNRVYSQKGLARTLMGSGGNAGDKTGLYLEESSVDKGEVIKKEGLIIDDTQGFDGTRKYENIAPTIRSQRSGLKVIENLRIRKLTPLECWRLQGFTDEQFYKAKNDGISNSQLYKQAGNSVTVNVIDAIVKELEV